MRIGVTCHPTYGGSGAVAMELANALVQRGHEVHVISYATPFRMASHGRMMLHEVSVPTYPLFKYPPYDMALASKMAEVSTRHRLEVFHAHYAIPHSMASYLAREIAGNPSVGVVTTLHGTDITLIGSDPSYRAATRYALTKSDIVTAVSQYLAQETDRCIGQVCGIRVIQNFVDPEQYKPRPRPEIRQSFAADDERLLAHMSNFRPVKRVQDVVEVFARVSSQVRSRLLMIGDGPERAAAEQKARERGVEDRVTFMGAIPDAALLLAQADLFLLPSAGESFGLAALEAMSCGVPVLGAKAGGLPEVVDDGVDGILEAVGDVTKMSERASALLLNPERLSAMGAAGRAKVIEKFRTERIVPLYEAAYRDALSARKNQA